MKLIASKTFGKFTAEIYPNEDREGVNCFISCGRSSSSLAKVEDYATVGEVDDRDGEIPIPDSTIDKIRAYAEGFGY